MAISIPSIGLNHTVSRIGGSSVLEPSPGQVSWYTGSVTPGSKGISVMLGHVTYNGADVFYNLPNIPNGASVVVRQANGGTHTFQVVSKFSENKNAMTHDARVWGKSSSPMLALVTCDKNSGWASATHHKNNYVIILKMVK